MPLDRRHITAASRITLPTYVVLFAALGSNYLYDPDRLQASPGLHFADSIMPLQVWGGMFVVVASLMLAALVTHVRAVFQYALLVAIISESLWSLSLLLGAFTAELSWTAWIRDAAIAAFCFASYRSLMKREV